jgi:hypothetical protein
MRQLVDVRSALQRFLSPAGHWQAEAENEAIHTLGEDLRTRLERELGPGYRVTYQPSDRRVSLARQVRGSDGAGSSLGGTVCVESVTPARR